MSSRVEPEVGSSLSKQDGGSSSGKKRRWSSSEEVGWSQFPRDDRH